MSSIDVTNNDYYNAYAPTPSAPPQDYVEPLYPVLHRYDSSAPDIFVDPIYSDTFQRQFFPVPVQNQQQTYPTQYPQTVHVPPSVMPPSMPLLTQAIHNATLGLLSKAHELTGSSLGQHIQRPPSYAPHANASHRVQPNSSAKQGSALMPPVNIDLSDRSWKMFNHETHIHHHDEKKDKEKDDKTTRVIVGLIGLIVAFATAFFVGKVMAEGEEVKEEASSFEELKGSWGLHKNCYGEDYRSLVDCVVKRADIFLQRKQTNRTHKVALLIFGLIAGGTAFAGALLGSGALMIAGAGIGATVSVVALYKLGYACFSKLDQEDAKAIDQALYELQQLPQPVVVS